MGWLGRLFGFREDDPARRERPPESRRDAKPVRPPAAGALFRNPATGEAVIRPNNTDTTRLAKLGLPLLQSAEDVAHFLGVTMRDLRFLMARGGEARLRHYREMFIDKRGGGARLLCAPKRRLKRAQRVIHENLLRRVPPHDAAMAFRAGRSLLDNARPHVGKDMVVRFDLRDFFPSITRARVMALFRAWGYGSDAAAILSILTTYEMPPDIRQELARRNSAPRYRRFLPQGAPTSPALSNHVAHCLDIRLAALAKQFEIQYTRYADDLTFSGPRDFRMALKRFLPLLRDIVRDEGFALQPKKTRFSRRGRRQKVTGVIVNDGLSVSRDERRRLRAILHECRTKGVAAANREQHSHFAQHLRGRIEFVRYVNADQGDVLLDEYEEVFKPVR